MTEPLNVVLFKWRPRPGYRSKFEARHVNTVAAMVRRHYARPHRVWCVTDDAEGIDEAIGIVPLWSDHAEVPNPHPGNHPSCYRRLKLFDPDTAAPLGPRLVWLDLDCVIVGDLAPLWNRPEPVVCWGGQTNPNNPINGSMLLMDAGARPDVWTEFDPKTTPRKTVQAGFFGSDQAWLAMKLGRDVAKWTRSDGVCSYRLDVKPRGGRLPPNARVVMFHGHEDPDDDAPQRLAWVREHYRV